MELENAKINFLGDSITEGHGIAPEETFVSRIAEATGALCRNYGIGGTRIARQRVPSEKSRWDMDFCSRAGQMDPDADVVVVFGGTNDFGHGDAPMGTMEDRTVDSFYGALHTLYLSLLNRFPRSSIVILTPLHRITEDMPVSQSGRFFRHYPLKDYVRAIREVAEYYALPVLDLYAVSGLQPRVEVINEAYFLDGLHPNADGHKILAHQVMAFLRCCPEKRRILDVPANTAQKTQ